MAPPLLSCESARIDVGGAALLESLSCVTQSDRVGLVGAWDPLFALLARQARVTAGSVRVHDHDAFGSVADGVVGLALYEPGMPLGWTSIDYLTRSATLAGFAPRHARSEAASALERVGLGALAKRKLGQLAAAERRAVLVVHATLGTPAVLALQTPLAGLEETSQQYLIEVIERATADSRLLVSMSDPTPSGPERTLLSRLDELLVLQGGMLVAQGSAAQMLALSSRYLVVVTRGAPRLLEELRQQGLQAQVAGPASASEAARLVVDVGERAETDAILDAALAADAPIIELVPLDCGGHSLPPPQNRR